MSMFHVGQKVVLAVPYKDAESRWKFGPVVLPNKGQIYTVRATRVGQTCPQAILLAEISNRTAVVSGRDSGIEIGFAAWRFRPVQTRETSIECFRALLNTKPGDIDADHDLEVAR